MVKSFFTALAPRKGTLNEKDTHKKVTKVGEAQLILKGACKGCDRRHSHEGGQDCASAPEYQFQRIWDGALEYSSFISQGNPHGASRAETR